MVSPYPQVDPEPRPGPGVRVEVVLSAFALDGSVMRVLMGRDAGGAWSLPTADLAPGQTAVAGALGAGSSRGLGLVATSVRHVGLFDDPGRAGIALSQAAVCPGPPPSVRAGGGEWVDPVGLGPIAGDHGAILDAAMRWLAEGIRRGPLALEFLGEEFGIDDVDRLIGSLGGNPARARAWRERLEEEGQIVRLFGRRARFRVPARDSIPPG